MNQQPERNRKREDDRHGEEGIDSSVVECSLEIATDRGRSKDVDEVLQANEAGGFKSCLSGPGLQRQPYRQCHRNENEDGDQSCGRRQHWRAGKFIRCAIRRPACKGTTAKASRARSWRYRQPAGRLLGVALEDLSRVGLRRRLGLLGELPELHRFKGLLERSENSWPPRTTGNPLASVSISV